MGQLAQSTNNVVIVGKLKTKEIKYGQSKTSGKVYASGKLVIECENSYGISEHTVRLFQFQLKKDNSENALYKAIQTIDKEFKTVENNGNDADFVRITGSLEENSWYNENTQEINTNTQIKGVFVNRLDKEKQMEQGCFLEIEGVIQQIEPADDKVKVKLIGIAYGSEAYNVPLVVEGELATQFQTIYMEGHTATFYCNILNVAEEAEVESQEEAVFGIVPKKIIKRVKKDIVITGGKQPKAEGYDIQLIKEALKQREIKLEALKTQSSTQDVSPFTQKPSGFENPFANNNSPF